MAIVLDASTALGAVLPNEDLKFAESAVAAAATQGAIAPVLWPYELQNGLVMAFRRKRIDAEGLERSLDVLRRFVPQLRAPEGLGAELRLAQKYGLSAYDAAYLAVAIAENAILATIDERLRVAARSAGVTLFACEPPQRRR